MRVLAVFAMIALMLCWAAGGARAQAPDPPTQLAAVGGDTVIDLSWELSPSEGVTQYRICRGTAHTGPYNQVGTATAYDTTYHDTNLTNGTDYYYVVRAWDGNEESANSNEATDAPYIPPGAPSNLAAAAGTGVIALTWSAATQQTFAVAGYFLYRGTDTGQEGETPIFNRPVNALKFGDVDVESYTTYYYVARAVDTRGHLSSASNEASAMTTSDPVTIYASVEEAVDSGRPSYAFGEAYGSTQNAYMGGLFVGFSNDPAKVGRSYLRFDLSSLPNGKTIVGGKLYAYLNRVDSTFSAGDTPIGAHRCATDTWTKSGLTWAGAPGFDSVATCIVNGPFTAKTWVGWNVGGDVQTEYDTDDSLSVVLRAQDETAKNWKYFTETSFSSTYRPYLKVGYYP